MLCPPARITKWDLSGEDSKGLGIDLPSTQNCRTPDPVYGYTGREAFTYHTQRISVDH